MDRRFPAEHRLKLKRDFDRVFDEGRRAYATFFMIVVAPGPGLDHHRIGLSVGSRVGGAVVRNRIKRYIREYYRVEKKYTILKDMTRGADIVVIAKKDAAKLDFKGVCGELERCWRKFQSG